ncbi:MAG: alpha/beta fold hydrolase [Alcanivorax sp.]|nr:alpha/beta fold hydrolase [Alcanivorax sp.]
MAELLWLRPAAPVATLVFAHGAGAPMDSDVMARFAALCVARNVTVVRFEFPYMRRRREGGRRRPPDRPEVLLDCFAGVVAEVRKEVRATEAAGAPRPLLIGGKSMGGRMATMLAAEPDRGAMPDGVVCMGYPFHPPGKPERLRLDHWPALQAPVLICQGERDTFGTREEVAGYALGAQTQLCWLADGNHDLKPRKASGLSHEDNLVRAADGVVDWLMDGLINGPALASG